MAFADATVVEVQVPGPQGLPGSLDPAFADGIASLNETADFVAGKASAAADSEVAAAEFAAAAEIAAAAALAGADELYPDTSAGLAATVDGSFFLVVGDDETTYALVYENVSGVAELRTTYPSKTSMDTAIAASSAGDRAFAEQAASAAVRDAGVLLIDLPGYIAAIADSDGKLTWLAARDTDGAPSDYSLSLLLGRINEENVVPQAVTVPGYLVAITDSQRRATWLLAREEDGQPPDWVIDMLAARIGVSSGGAALRIPDMSVWAGWGSSSVNRMQPYLSALAAEFGATYYSGGKGGGVRANDNLVMMGALSPALTVAGGSIPTSGPVDVSSTISLRDAILPVGGFLAGVYGNLESVDGQDQFTRLIAGDAVAVSGAQTFTPDVGGAYRNAVTILNIGKNNLTDGETADAVLSYYEVAAAHVRTSPERILYLGHYVDQDIGDPSAVRTAILAVNAGLAAAHPHLYIDQLAYLTSSQVWTDTGITPDSGDLAQQAAGNIPASLCDDDIHLSATGYEAVVENLIKPRIEALGWYRSSMS